MQRSHLGMILEECSDHVVTFGDQPAGLAEVEQTNALTVGRRQADDVEVVMRRRKDFARDSDRRREHTESRQFSR